MRLEDESYDSQVRRLSIIFSPTRSRIRTFLGLYGIKSHVLIKNGCPENNCPTISWYLYHLRRAGVSQNYWNIRRHLKRMSELGIFIEKKTTRLIQNNISKIYVGTPLAAL